MTALAARASRQVSATSGAVFRIGFGLVGVILVARFFAMGWIDSLLVDPAYHFPYPGFEWVRPWPAPWMHLHFVVIGLAAAGIAVGYRYRMSATVLVVALGYVELIDRSLYLNHYYWMVLTAAVMVFLPLHAVWSIDARVGRAPVSYQAWVVWALRFQVGMVYFFAGLAKLNEDWLLRAEPLSTWLPARSELFLIGPLLTLPVTAVAASWLGAFFDLTIVGWLSWRRTRPFAYGAIAVFHTVTWVLFPSIGLFPLLMTISALVFFEPDWPLLLPPVSKASVGGSTPQGGRGLSPGWALAGATYVLLMVALPLRHHLAPGDVKWNGEGYLGSWQVMLSEKSASADFIVTDPSTGDTWTVPPPQYLTERQQMVMATDPVMIRQAAALVASEVGGGVRVAADVRVSFNGRPNQQFTDPEVVISDQPVSTPITGFVIASPAD
jgi:hypothetical protein